MQPSSRFAFKEWAVVCAALASGRQSLILRKGGIHEGREGFRVEQREFWLFPTNFHQNPEELIPEAHPLLEQVRRECPPEDTLRLDTCAVVQDVIRIGDESQLPRLAGFHVWSHRTLSERFHYRTPGLFALLVRIHRRDEPYRLPNSPHFAGCRSWVDLPEELPTDGLRPVLSDDEHERRMRTLRQALTPVRLL